MQRTPYKDEEQAKAGRPDHKNKDQDLGTTDQDETDNELEDRGIRKEINLKLINEGKLKRYPDTQIPPIYRDPKTEVEYQFIPDGQLKKVHDPRED